MKSLAEIIDGLYAWLWRVPSCTPGNCYCRRTCECIVMDEEPQA